MLIIEQDHTTNGAETWLSGLCHSAGSYQYSSLNEVHHGPSLWSKGDQAMASYIEENPTYDQPTAEDNAMPATAYASASGSAAPSTPSTECTTLVCFNVPS